MLYRLYTPEDFPQLYAIELACFEPPIRFPRRYMHQIIANPNSATWVAEQEGELAGFAIVDWFAESDRTTAYIETIEVAPAHRKHGIAAELLSRVEASAQAAAAQILWLHVAEQNTPAIRLYQAHGFLPQGSEEDYYAPGLRALIFAKPIEIPLRVE